MSGLHLNNSSGVICDQRNAVTVADAQRVVPERSIEGDLATEHGVSHDLGPCSYATLNHLRDLHVLSLIGYEEIAESSANLRLESFANVILRQRSAQQRALYKYTANVDDVDASGNAANRALLRCFWRLAIVCLQRNNFVTFSEYVQRAEAYLEEAYLAAAKSVIGHGLAEELRDYALMIYGARTFFEEFADTSRHSIESSATLARFNMPDPL